MRSESNISEIGWDLKFMIKILFPGPKALPKPILGFGSAFGLGKRILIINFGTHPISEILLSDL